MRYLLFLFVELIIICKYEFRAWTFLSPSQNCYYLNSAWSSRPNYIQRQRRKSWSRNRILPIPGNGVVVDLALGNNVDDDDDDEVFSSLEHPQQQKVRSTVPFESISASTTDNSQSIGLNELQTLLREAVATENYKEAARLRDCIAQTLSQTKTTDDDPRKFQRLSWVGLGTAPWLVDRLEALNYILPTTIQIHAFESINEMLLKQMNQTTFQEQQQQTLEELVDAASASSYNYGDSQRRGKRTNMAVIVSGSTGSGKTLAYLVPLLSTLSESLFERQRIRVKAESDVVDAADDLLSRVAIQTSPEVRGRSSRPMVNAAARVPLSMGKSGRDVTSPLALIVVPSRELGIQTAMTLYELVGGSTKRTPTEFSGKRNMFKFKGPRGVKISCILDDIEAESGLTMQTDVAITTPQYLTKLLHDRQIKPERLRVIVYDEADLALETTKEEDLKLLFQSTDTSKKNGMDHKEEEEEEEDYLDHSHSTSRLTYLVGASVTDSLQQIPPVREHVLQKDYTYLATATSFAPVVFENDATSQENTDEVDAAASLSQLKLHLDPGLIHERVVAPNNTRLLCLSRLLRKELQEYSRMANASTTNETGMKKKKKISSPRVVIFFPNEEEAKECMPKLRDAMWGDYKLCVLLPNTGVSPLTVMEDFKSNKTSVMLATANSIRGLDFEG